MLEESSCFPDHRKNPLFEWGIEYHLERYTKFITAAINKWGWHYSRSLEESCCLSFSVFFFAKLILLMTFCFLKELDRNRRIPVKNWYKLISEEISAPPWCFRTIFITLGPPCRLSFRNHQNTLESLTVSFSSLYL